MKRTEGPYSVGWVLKDEPTVAYYSKGGRSFVSAAQAGKARDDARDSEFIRHVVVNRETEAADGGLIAVATGRDP